MAIAIAMMSCSSKDNPQPGPKAQDGWYLYGWVDRGDDPSDEGELQKIEYNEDSTIRKIIGFAGKTEESGRYTVEAFSYLNKQMVKHEYFYDGDSAPYEYKNLEYKNGRLQRTILYVYESPRWLQIRIDSFFYNNAGQLSSYIEHMTHNDFTPVRILTNFTWTNGNMTEMKSLQSQGNQQRLTGHYKFEYSDKINFYPGQFKNDFVLKQAFRPMSEIHHLSRNLASKRVNALVTTFSNDTMYYQYTFAENGLPKSRQEKNVTVTDNSQYTIIANRIYDFRKLQY